MKISTKVVLLLFFLLTVLAVDGAVSFRLLMRMGNEIQGVVNRDVVLMQATTTVTKHQLEKAVILERVRRIAEELAYQETTPARKEHLLFYVGLAKTSFDELAKQGALNIINAKRLLDESMRSGVGQDLGQVAATLKEIEKAHIHYDALVGNIFSTIAAGKFDISVENIEQMHRDERKLTMESENFISGIEDFINGSLQKARDYQATARRILWMMLVGSLLAGLALAFWIIHSISGPLKTLVNAAHDVGSGKLDIHLKGSSRDEVGEVSKAFNRMAAQLGESKKELELQSEVLRHNLAVTEQQKMDLEKVNRELDRFVQTVSHDIRSPLMGISWYADFLKNHQYAQMDDKGRECLDGVFRGVDRANALIRDLLALTRISRVRNPYEYVQMGALVDEVVASLEYKIKQGRVDLKVQPNLPSIICDGIKVKEVFLNLLTNAIKFSTGNEGAQPRVEIAYMENVSTHEFVVSDNGIGIDSKYHDEIFAIFKRVDTSGKYEGTGAGLSIVKSVIDDHGGKVWVESEPEKGSAFHFTIPKGLELHKTVAL